MDDYSKKVKHFECLNVYQIKNAKLLEVKMHEFVLGAYGQSPTYSLVTLYLHDPFFLHKVFLIQNPCIVSELLFSQVKQST